MRIFFTLILLTIITGCRYQPPDSLSKVEIIKNGDGFSLLKNGKPFYIKGAVAWNKLELIKQYGGNAARVWSRETILAKADSLGISCLVNLPVKSERSGMNYDDTIKVQAQFDTIINYVQKLKDHPSVIMWALGNELDWIPPGIPYNPKVWDHLNDLAIKIHEIDPYHPVLTTIGSVHNDVMKDFMARAPEVDLVGVNEYGNILNLAEWMRAFGWKKPYVLTEWGPTGFWQVPQTEWKAPIEETSSMKANMYKLRYEEAILKDREMCLGSFVFLWNQHQERTHTWFGMFDREWRETEAVDVMHYEWSGTWPANRNPAIDTLQINGISPYENIYLSPGALATAQVDANDPDKDPLTYSWEVLKEGIHFPYGGGGERKPPAVPGIVTDSTLRKITFRAPAEVGPYRLFVYVYDGNNHFATANANFYVKEE